MKKSMILIATGIIAALMMTGCGKDADENRKIDASQELHLAVVIGNHKNAPKPNLSLIEDAVYQACYTAGSVTLVVDDGDPYTLVVDIPRPKNSLSASKYQKIAQDQTEQILTAAEQMQAKTEEVQTLKAVQLAARSLSSATVETEGTEMKRQMIICDSCLSTTGALSFLEYKLNTISPENIVSKLKEGDEIPALDHISVDVYTCGDTAGEVQKPLTRANQEKFKMVWKSILEAGNAETVDMKEDLPLSNICEGNKLPDVSPVMVVEDAKDIEETAEVADVFSENGVISFDETSIAFNEGTAELADKDAASKALGYVAEYMKDHPDFQLLIAGTTACWGGEEYCKSLSADRSETVCKLLTDEFKIDETRLKTIGVGYSFADFYTYDQTPEGELDEKIAPMNRSVKMVDLSSTIADQLINLK